MVFTKRRDGGVGGENNINTEKYWNSVYSNENMSNRYYSNTVQKVDDLVKSDSRVLDVGCGNSHILRSLRKKNCDRYGIDFSDVWFEELTRLGISCQKAKLPHIPFQDEYFDYVICSEVLEHIDEYEKTIYNMWRVLKKGGTLIISVPDGTVWGKGGEHIHAFTIEKMSNLLRPYIRPIDISLYIDMKFPHMLVYGRKIMKPPELDCGFQGESFPLYRKRGELLICILSSESYTNQRSCMESFKSNLYDLEINGISVNILLDGPRLIELYALSMTPKRKIILQLKNIAKYIVNRFSLRKNFMLIPTNGRELLINSLQQYDCIILSSPIVKKQYGLVSEVVHNIKKSLNVPIVDLEKCRTILQNSPKIESSDQFIKKVRSIIH